MARFVFRNFWWFIAVLAASSEWLLWWWLAAPRTAPGIHVIVIEPGLVKTEFGNTAVDTVGNHSADGPYGNFNAALQAKISSAYEGLLGKTAASPEGIAKLIGKAIASPRPRTRYVKPMTTRVLLFAKRVLPDRAFDAILRTQYPTPSPDDEGKR